MSAFRPFAGSKFRIEAVPKSRTLWVRHNDFLPHAVACLCPRDDGGVDLVPILYDRPPAPLTGREQPFDTLEAALAYLGIEQLSEAA